MEVQQKLIYINKLDLQETIAYLKDYSLLIGKTYNKTTDFKTKQQIASLNHNVNCIIKKLEKEI